MKINKINIDVVNPGNFADLAYLVDRDDFINDIEIAREKLKVKKLIDLRLFPLKLIKKSIRRYKSYLKTKKLEDKAIENFIKNIDDDELLGHAINYQPHEHEIITSILNKYHKSGVFYSVIRYIIYCGVATDRLLFNFNIKHNMYVYESEGNRAAPVFSAIAEDDSFMEDNYIKLGKTEMLILVEPETSRRQVMQAFDQTISKFKKTNKFWKTFDTVNNVQRDRDWYWMNKEGIGYGQIAKLAANENINITWAGVREAIKQYKKRLYPEGLQYS